MNELRFSAEAEKMKLNEIIKDIPAGKEKIIEGLIEDASFMIQKLEELRTYININGWADTYQNGANQYGRKLSVEADLYLKMQKNYQSIIRQLVDYLPTDKEIQETETIGRLQSFINAGKKITIT